MSNDPNQRTAAQNVKAILARYGYPRDAFSVQRTAMSRNICIVQANHGSVLEGANRCLTSAGLLTAPAREGLVVEA